MRVVLQRVTEASVTVDGRVVATIGHGLVALVGIAAGDGPAEADALAAKTVALRIFDTADGSRSVLDTGGEVLVVSQFTLLGDTTSGNRPSWSAAASGAHAEPLVARYAAAIAGRGLSVRCGVFGAHMVVRLTNDGPVTILLERDGT